MVSPSSLKAPRFWERSQTDAGAPRTPTGSADLTAPGPPGLVGVHVAPLAAGAECTNHRANRGFVHTEGDSRADSQVSGPGRASGETSQRRGTGQGAPVDWTSTPTIRAPTFIGRSAAVRAASAQGTVRR